MSVPDFDRAEYIQPTQQNTQPTTLDATPHYVEATPILAGSTFPTALLFGFGAAILGAIGYGLFSLTGWMISIVAIAIGWFVARAMMLGSGGIGGRPYQIAAVLLTYFAVSFGDLVVPLWHAHREGYSVLPFLSSARALEYIVAGPFMELSTGFSGILGLAILFFGLRAAWRVAAGGGAVARRPGLFGI